MKSRYTIYILLMFLTINLTVLGLITKAIATDNPSADQLSTENHTYKLVQKKPETLSKVFIRSCLNIDDHESKCFDNLYSYFGTIIKTKEYTVIPIFLNCGGTACEESDTFLLIEHEKQVSLSNALKGHCLECGLLIDSDFENDNFKYKLERDGKFEYFAKFTSGKFQIEKNALSITEPIDIQTCNQLYTKLSGCADSATEKQNCPEEFYSHGMVDVRWVLGLPFKYPSFDAKAYENSCTVACETKTVPTEKTFQRNVCHR
jgi:hypothetical protein